MFPADFADLWSPVAYSHTLKKKPISRKLAGVDIALFRGRDGKVGALVDRCPHRGVKLSLGTITEDGCLACPFHAWEFATDGACTHVPFSPQLDEVKRRNLGARALPVIEKAGLIFVFTGPVAQGEPFVPAALLRGDVVRSYLEVPWETHWTRAMENMLDSPHLPFVHRKSIGRGLAKHTQRNAVMEIDVDETDSGFRSRMRILVDGKRVDGEPTREPGSEEGAFLDWNRPNGMTLQIPVPFGQWRQHVWCVPIDDTHVNMMIYSTRDFGRWNPIWKIADLTNRKVQAEDSVILRTSSPALVPPASEEKSSPTDHPTLRFRRWVRGRIDAREVDAAGKGLRIVAS